MGELHKCRKCPGYVISGDVICPSCGEDMDKEIANLKRQITEWETLALNAQAALEHTKELYVVEARGHTDVLGQLDEVRRQLADSQAQVGRLRTALEGLVSGVSLSRAAMSGKMFAERLTPRLQAAHDALAALEKGAIE